MAELYNWKRFWCPRSGDIRLDWRGYLSDPESDWGRHENPNLVTIDKLADVPCLVLLGEPGIGKSQEMTDLVNHTAGSQSHSFIEINLRSCSHLASDLSQEPGFVSWMDGSDRLYLFLDSLDEGLLEARNLAVQIVDEFRKKKYRDKLDRLYLRIACRTAVFPQVLEEGLGEIWGDDNTDFYELAPLRQADVEVAANQRGIDAQTFLAEIDRRKIASFAIKPITLKFLINRFKKHNGHFPEEQSLADIYLDGCRALCEDPNPSRRVGLTRRLEVEQRLIVAARIAAVTIFANRFAVWTEPDTGDIPVEDVLIRVLAVQSETASGNSFLVSEDVIREVLDTGLFSSRGVSGRMGWAHQIYAEFLAAWYLQTHDLSLEQVLSLILNDDRVVPQLQEAVAWLASMIPEVFEEVMKIDPDVLLQSDVASRAEEDKAHLVDSLLRAYDEERLRYRFNKYQHLNHSNIGTQLRAYICDSEKSESSRLVAIDICSACGIHTLQDDLLALVFDSSEIYQIRIQALRALGEIAGPKSIGKLKQLVTERQEDDISDRLKGHALKILFPNHIELKDLLKNLSEPKTKVIGNPYSDFIANDFSARLSIKDLPQVLKWVESRPGRHSLRYPWCEMDDAVMLKAWQHLHEPKIADAFACVAKIKLEQDEGLLGHRPPISYTSETFESHCDHFIERLVREDAERRRGLIQKLISIVPKSVTDCPWLTQIVCSEDILWLIENSVSIEDKQETNIWIKLLRQSLMHHNFIKENWKKVEHVEAILEACKKSSDMRSEFKFETEFDAGCAVELNTRYAKDLRANYLKWQYQATAIEPEILLDPMPKQRVLDVLGKVEAGAPELWWQIVMELTLKPTSTHYIFPDSMDVTRLAGWQEAETHTRLRIIKEAKCFIDTFETKKNAGTNILGNDTFAIFQALYLIAKEESNTLAIIAPDVWGKCMPVIHHVLDSHFGQGAEDDKYCIIVVKTAYSKSPKMFIKTLTTLMIRKNYQLYTYYIEDAYRRIKQVLQETLTAKIIEEVDLKSIQPGMLALLLEDLFISDFDEAKQLGLKLLFEFADEDDNYRAIAVSHILLRNLDDSIWKPIWKFIQGNSVFGKQLLEDFAQEAVFETHIEQKLTELELADLYIFLEHNYTFANDILDSADTLVSLKHAPAILASWKNIVLQQLCQRDNDRALQGFQKIVKEFPGQRKKLQSMLLDAEASNRHYTWKPATPKQLFQLVYDREKRLVQNGQQLLDVLAESLKRLELELQGETPAVRDLWDKTPSLKQKTNQDNYTSAKKTFRPNDENDFSDYVKRFLDRDLKMRGIIVNREVELRRSYGGNPGERTDIHVDAVVKAPNGETYDTITVIIEVKGCWHKEVQTAMQTQLLDRYLAENASPYGLYLVGWFNCEQWDNKDSRKKQTPKMTLDEARAKLDEQARSLTSSGKTIYSFVLNTALR
jgi:hypothetical protein